MVNRVLELLQNNIMVISLLLFMVIVLFVIFKTIRKIVYGLLSTGLISLMLLILYKLGIGFESFYQLSNRVLIYISNGLSEIQELLLRSKNVLFFILTFKAYSETGLIYYSYDNMLIELPLFISSYIISNVRIKIQNITYELEEKIIKRIKLSTYNFVYRL